MFQFMGSVETTHTNKRLFPKSLPVETNVTEDLGKWMAKEVWPFGRKSAAPFPPLPVREVNAN